MRLVCRVLPLRIPPSSVQRLLQILRGSEAEPRAADLYLLPRLSDSLCSFVDSSPILTSVPPENVCMYLLAHTCAVYVFMCVC